MAGDLTPKTPPKYKLSFFDILKMTFWTSGVLFLLYIGRKKAVKLN